MNRFFISVEGAAEQAIIDLLLNKYNLFNNSQNVDVKVIRSRSSRRIEEEIGLNHDGANITLIRILDSPNEKFKLKRDFLDKITVESYFTKPEIEILYIIAENKYDNFTNKCNNIKASEYVKRNLKIKNCKSYDYTYDFFLNKNLIDILREYKSLKKVSEDCIYDLFIKYENI